MAFIEDIVVQVIPGAPTVTREGFGIPLFLGTTGQRGVAFVGSGNGQVIVQSVNRHPDLEVTIQTGAYNYVFTPGSPGNVTIDVPLSSNVRDLVADFNANAPVSVTDEIQLIQPGTGTGEVVLVTDEPLAFTTFRQVVDISQLDYFYDQTDGEYIMALNLFASVPRPLEFYLLDVFGSGNTIEQDLGNSDNGTWYAIVTNAVDEATQQSIANYVDVNNRIAIFTTTSAATTSIDNVKSRRVAFLSHDVIADHPEVSWASLNLPSDPGSITWKWKGPLARQTPNTTSSLTDLLAVRNAGGQSYVLQNGIALVDEGQVNPLPGSGNQYLDQIRSQDWIQSNLEADLLQLFVDNPKIPYTDGGIAQIVGVITNRLSLAGAQGIIAPVEDEAQAAISRDGNFQFSVTAPTRAEIEANNPSNITNRILEDVTFQYVEAGAIHEVKPITGRVVLSLG